VPGNESGDQAGDANDNGGDQETLTIWRAFCDESLRHCHAIYDKLGITGLIDRYIEQTYSRK